MGWKKIWARLAPKVISLSTSMEGTSPYIAEKSDAISSGDKDALRNIQDKEGSLARKAAAAQLGLAVAPQILPVIANPATASTTAGAVAATGLDAAGLIGGLSQLNNYWNNRNNLTWKDAPEIILSGLTLVPGSSQLTNVKNWGTAANSVSNLVKPITGTIKANALARHIRINHPNLVQNLSQTGEHSQSLARIWNNYTGQNIRIDPKLIENAEKVQAALLYGPEKTLVPSARLYGFGTKNLSRMGIDDSVIQTISGTTSKYPSQASKKLIAAQNLPDNVTLYSGPGPKQLKYLGHGQEHEVYKDGENVIKFRFHRNPDLYLPYNPNYSKLTDEVTSTGAYRYKKQGAEFIPEREYLGVGIDDGGNIVPVFKESFIEGQTPTQQQLNEAFTKYGINYDGTKQVTFKDGSIALDVNPKNVKLVDGKPIIIDPIAGSLYNPNFRHYKFKSKQVLSGSRPISEAEKLGIPKSMRSNPKALEDPYYWGYQQWNSRYNNAIDAENMEEVQRLRDLHFKTKSYNSNKSNVLYKHSTDSDPFYEFDLNHATNHAGSARNGKGVFLEPIINLSEEPGMANWARQYSGNWGNRTMNLRVNFKNPEISLIDNPTSHHPEGYVSKVEAFVRDPKKIKLDDAITKTDAGEIIPIVKRDNFRNPDIRYKQGGIIKGQNGFLNIWQKACNSKLWKGLCNFLNGADSDLSDEEYLEKHGYNKPIGSIGILGALVAPEWEGLEALPVAENFGRTGTVKAVPKTAQMISTKIKNFEGVPQISKVEPVKELTKFEKFLQRPIKEQDDIVRFWNGEKFSNMEMLKLDKKAYQQFKNWINK